MCQKLSTVFHQNFKVINIEEDFYRTNGCQAEAMLQMKVTDQHIFYNKAKKIRKTCIIAKGNLENITNAETKLGDSNR